MTLRWTPDTCYCILDYEIVNGEAKFVGWVQKCHGHKDLDGQALFDECANNCKKYALSKADQKIRKKVLDNIKEKRDDKNKNFKAGPIVKNEKLIRNSKFLN